MEEEKSSNDIVVNSQIGVNRDVNNYEKCAVCLSELGQQNHQCKVCNGFFHLNKCGDDDGSCISCIKPSVKGITFSSILHFIHAF